MGSVRDRVGLLASVGGWCSVATSTVILVSVVGGLGEGLNPFIGGIVFLGWVAGYAAIRWPTRPAALAGAAGLLVLLALGTTFSYFFPPYVLALLLMIVSLGLRIRSSARDAGSP